MIAFADEDLGLFDLADLAPPPPELLYGDNLLAEQEAAPNLHTMLDLFDAWHGERIGRRGAWSKSYVWSPTVCGPKIELGLEECSPVILSVDLRCDRWAHDREGRDSCQCVGELIYRHGCGSCGHVDPPREHENEAAEDAMTHRWPGWRDLPIGPRWDYDGPESGKGKAVEKWLGKCAAAGYDVDQLRAGGPIRTARQRFGTRHVPGRTPFGGYDLAVLVEESAS